MSHLPGSVPSACRATRQNAADTPFPFVVSAVPVLHTRAALVSADELLGNVGDDLPRLVGA